MTKKNAVRRRDFVRGAVGISALTGLAKTGIPSQVKQSSAAPIDHTMKANEQINVALIGVGTRGSSLMRLVLDMAQRRGDIKIVAVCDVYEKRKRLSQEVTKAAFATLDYREVLTRSEVDAVIVATPDHWHAPIAIAAINAGKDVYLEKPMSHTIEEAKKIADRVRESGQVLQVGSQTTSSDQWWKARKAIQDGMIGKLISSQGSYHRNSLAGEWNTTPDRGNRNWVIDPDAGPDGKGVNYIDWKMWLGSAPEQDFDPQRYFRFRKFWDYSGGIATDLFYHVVAPLQICWGEAQFPYRVMASGGVYAFPDREVPDTFNLLADFSKGHSLVLSSSMANSTHTPGLIRGQEGTIVMVDHGRFEGQTDHITVNSEKIYRDKFIQKFGYSSVDIPVENHGRDAHMANFFECMKTRKKPHLDADTGYRAQATISMAVQSYREGKVLYFDPRKEIVVDQPPEA